MGGSISDLVAELQPFASDLVNLAGNNRLQPRVTSTVRTHSEQARLYRRYLAGKSGYPVAPPGQSAHEYGEAFDMVVSPMEYLEDLGGIWRGWGGGWSPADAIHFELPGASERAAAQPQTSDFQQIARDPTAYLSERASQLPWYVGLFLPWQLDLYNALPLWVRASFNPSAASDLYSQLITYLIRNGFSF